MSQSYFSRTIKKENGRALLALDVEKGFSSGRNLATYVVISGWFGGRLGKLVVLSAYINNGEYIYDPATHYSGVAVPNILGGLNPEEVKNKILCVLGMLREMIHR